MGEGKAVERSSCFTTLGLGKLFRILTPCVASDK